MGANGKSNLKDGVKAPGNDTYKGGNWWHDPQSITRRHSSKSSARKVASAQIAKIPFALSEYIARSFRPEENA